MQDVHRHVTRDVPAGAFYPMGIKSQVLLTNEAVMVDPEAALEMEEHAIARAEADWYAKQNERAELAGHGTLLNFVNNCLFIRLP